MVHLNIRITGKVQGVYYRSSAKEKAEELGLTGFVRNEPDESVYLEVEGTADQIEKLVAWCKQGPPGAKVQNVITMEGALESFKTFEIRR